jgi:hypothetical protein
VPVAFDDSAFPRVEVRWTGAATDAELADFFQQMNRQFARGQAFSLLVDCRGAAGLTADQRRRLLVHMKETAASAEALLVQAIVLDSALLRTFYFGLVWAIPMGFPSKSFAEPEPAREWLAAQLRGRLPSKPQG